MFAAAHCKAADRAEVARVRRGPVSYTHLRAHETVLDLVCRLLLEKKKREKTRKQTDVAITTHKHAGAVKEHKHDD